VNEDKGTVVLKVSLQGDRLQPDAVVETANLENQPDIIKIMVTSLSHLLIHYLNSPSAFGQAYVDMLEDKDKKKEENLVSEL